jgi:hypothetical protein
MRTILGHKKWLLTIGMVFVLAGLAWSQRTAILSWYYLRELGGIDEASREAWVGRVASLDWATVPGLLKQLTTQDPTICNNIEGALVALTRRWGPEDPRTHALAEELREGFANWSPLGKISGLHVMTAMLSQEGAKTWPLAVTRTAGELLDNCRDRPELRGSALVLAGALLDRVPQGPWLDTSRILAEKGLADRFPRIRLLAIQVLMRSPLHLENALLAKVVPMLRDDSPAIRRAALVALAPAREIVSEDDLLPLLHDADFELQQLCEAALRSRGLGDEHIEMARDISDASPAARLRVIERIGRARDLDNPSAWLRRLSQDSCSAVRAAAIRAAAQHPRVDIGDRLREMALQDPSETVRQNAQYFLNQGPSGK